MTITTVQQEKITELKAKLQFALNQLKDEKSKKAVEVETANQNYKNALNTINSSYSAKIDALNTEIESLNSQLEAVK